MTPLALQSLARAGAGAIVDSLVLGFIVAAVAWAVLALLRNHRAAIRFLVMAAALVCLAVLPVVRALVQARVASAPVPLIHLGESFAVFLALFWAAGAFVGLVRLVAGLISLHSMRRRCRPLALAPDFEADLRKICPTRRVELLAGDAVSVPSAIGFFRPAVILPPWLLEELSTSELRQILIHELSHLRRRDDWTNLLQRVVKAVFFFHPAVWWMESRLSLEREMACDDAVLAHSPSARDYAECLAHLAEKSLLRRGFALAQAAVSRVRETTCRVKRILQLDRPARGGKLAVSIATVFAITGFCALLQAPTLVSFSASHSVASAEPSSSVALASSRHPAGSPVAVNAKLVARPDLTPPAPRSLNAVWNSTSAHSGSPAVRSTAAHPEATVLQAKHSKPTVHAVQAGFTAGSVRGRTLVFVTQDLNSITVWRITTWEFVPSAQARADHKTT